MCQPTHYSRGVPGGLAGLLVGASLAGVALPADPPSPETITEGLRDRSDRIETLQGYATLRAWYSDHEVAFRRDRWNEPGLGKVGLVRFAFWIAGDRWRIETLELIGSGDSRLGDWAGKGEDPAECSVGVPRRYSCWVSDGESVTQYLSVPRLGFAMPFADSHRLNPKIRLLREMLLLPDARGYTEALQRHEKVEVSGPVEVLGETCYVFRFANVIEGVPNRGEKAVCADKGYAIVRLRGVSGSPDDPALGHSRVYEAFDLQDAGDGIWLPRETRLDKYRYPAEDGDAWAYTWLMTFEGLAVNEAVDPSLFVFHPPLGARIVDSRQGHDDSDEWPGLGDGRDVLGDTRRDQALPPRGDDAALPLHPGSMGDGW